MSMESNMSGMMPPPPVDNMVIPPCASCTSCTSGRGNASGASHTSGWKYASVSGNSEFPAGSVGGEERKVVLDDGR